MSWARAFFAGISIMWVLGCSTVTEQDLADLQSTNAIVKQEAIARISRGPSFPLTLIDGVLSKRNEAKAVDIMATLLQEGNEPKDVQLNILTALAGVSTRTQASNAALVEKSKDKDPQVRTRAIEALARTKNKLASKALVRLLDEEPDKYPIIWALGEIGDQGSIPALDRLLASQDAYVRYNTRKALAKIGKDQAEVSSNHAHNSDTRGLLEIATTAFKKYQRAMIVVFQKIRGVKRR